jgi:hypothetical protein
MKGSPLIGVPCLLESCWRVLPALAAFDAGTSSQLFVLVLANLLSSLFDDAAHRPPSLSPLPTLPL